MFYWHLWPHMLAKGWTRPADLANGAGITKPTAKRLLADNQPYIRDLDLVVLAKCAAALGVPANDPWRLLEYRDD